VSVQQPRKFVYTSHVPPYKGFNIGLMVCFEKTKCGRRGMGKAQRKGRAQWETDNDFKNRPVNESCAWCKYLVCKNKTTNLIPICLIMKYSSVCPYTIQIEKASKIGCKRYRERDPLDHEKIIVGREEYVNY
jgi:hypothetical protein